MRTGGMCTFTNGWLSVSVLLLLPRACVCVCVVVCRDQLLLDQPDWDFDGFMSTHLSDYLVMSKEFMDEFYAEQQQ